MPAGVAVMVMVVAMECVVNAREEGVHDEGPCVR
jgi:hypothetical protein